MKPHSSKRKGGLILGRCDVHDKALFTTRADAKAYLKLKPDADGMRPYPCTAIDGML